MSDNSHQIIQDLTRKTSANDFCKDKTFLILQDKEKVLSTEAYRSHRDRDRGVFTTLFAKSFFEYVKHSEPENTRFFVSQDSLSCTAILNFKAEEDKQGFCDNKAVLRLSKTESYETLDDLDSDALTQNEFIRFIEDHASEIVFFNTITCADTELPFNLDGVVTWFAGDYVPTNRAIMAIRKIQINKKTSGNSEQANFGAKKSVQEEIEAVSASEQSLPAYFSFAFEPYEGFGKICVTAKIVLHVPLAEANAVTAPSLSFRIIGKGAIRRGIATKFAQMIQTGLLELDNGNQVYLGEYVA